jgi:hypothetical protein
MSDGEAETLRRERDEARAELEKRRMWMFRHARHSEKCERVAFSEEASPAGATFIRCVCGLEEFKP